MDKRVAIITGGAQGVGKGVAQRFIADGITRLALVDMNSQELERAAQELRKAGGDILAIVADLRSPAVCADAVLQTEAKFGRVDILANCAGNTSRGGLLDTSEEVFDGLFDVNIKAPFFMMQAAAKSMLQRKSGVIINMSSMLAHGGPPFLLTYSATKAALVTATKSAANALKREGIRVFAINLGWTVTPTEHKTQTHYHGMPEDWASVVGAKQPFGRLLLPEDPAGVCSFLVSKDAAMMTGVIIDLEQFVIGTSEAALGAAE